MKLDYGASTFTREENKFQYFFFVFIMSLCMSKEKSMGCALTLNLLTTTIVAPPSNASKRQMGFNSTFKGVEDG